MPRETNPEKWERIKRECEETGQDPYAALLQLMRNEAARSRDKPRVQKRATITKKP